MSDDAKAAYKRRWRQTERGQLNMLVSSKALTAAVKWVQTEHPDVWSRLLDEAWAAFGEEPAKRRPRRV